MQNQAVPEQGGVLGAQDKQGRQLEYMQRVKDWPKPKAGMKVSKFLGFVEYYCTFIPQYSFLTNRLKGIKKVEKFLWREILRS